MPEKPMPFANTTEFYAALGRFYAAWSRTDLGIDCAAWKALGERARPEAVHKRVAAMTFARKCDYFRSQLSDDKFENIARITGLLTQITDHVLLRNAFAHSFLASDERSVQFIHRPRRGHLIGYVFSREEFLSFVAEFVQLSFDFQNAVGLSNKDVADFAVSAVPLPSD